MPMPMNEVGSDMLKLWRYSAAFVDRILNLNFMFIFVMLSSDLNVDKKGPGIAMPP